MQDPHSMRLWRGAIFRGTPWTPKVPIREGGLAVREARKGPKMAKRPCKFSVRPHKAAISYELLSFVRRIGAEDLRKIYPCMIVLANRHFVRIIRMVGCSETNNASKDELVNGIAIVRLIIRRVG
jgi:hypothetical protein